MTTVSGLRSDIAATLRDPVKFSARAGRTTLRSYQVGPIQAIVRSIREHLALDFVVIFPRRPSPTP